jgi:RHS repeat-associated protein
MQILERSWTASSYRFGFQDQEKDNEVKGEGNGINFKFRMHDPRVGRFFSVDPLTSKYPYWSPYVFSGNIVIHAYELEGLEAVVGISMGGDVDYRKSHLTRLHTGAVTKSIVSPNLPTDPSEITSLVDVLSTATTNDASGTIGFIALWGHGYGGNIYGSEGATTNPTGSLEIADLDGLRTAIANGDIVFADDAVILITACNAGTDVTVPDGAGGTRTTSLAQEIADITGAKVIAGRNVSGDGGVSPLKETPGVEMSYQMRNYSQGSFYQFETGLTPVDIGNTYQTSTGIAEGTVVPAPPPAAPAPVVEPPEGE